MKILGMFAPGENPSAALMVEGKLVAWAEEERFNRIKTSPDNFPFKAAEFCLKKGGITLDEIDGIAYGWDCERYQRECPQFFKNQQKLYPSDNSFNMLQEELFLNLYHPDRIRHTLQMGLRRFGKTNKLPPVTFYSHHLCHAASAYFCSGFDEANILTLDGSGEEITTLFAKGSGGQIKEIGHIELPHTLGGFYATFTEYSGFIPYRDEGKLMGLASYGKYSEDWQAKLDKVIAYDKETGMFTVNPYMRYLGKHTFGNRFTDELVALFGPPRNKSQDALTPPYPDIAFAVQRRLEEIVIALVKNLHRQTGLRKLCLAGGVAMNCVMNGKLAALDIVDDIFVQPASADNGVALGAALLYSQLNGINPSFKMTHAYWGPSFSDEQIKAVLDNAKVKYRKSEKVAAEVADFLHQGKIIGWFQGAMEVGARALGNRSILANPFFPDTKDKLNQQVKHREHWRPFCPSLKAEIYEKIIKAEADSPFMILAFPVQEQYRTVIPSCVHVDGTARPQVVQKKDNPLFWELLDELKKRSGYGVVLNTSFNVQGEPIICTPEDAVRCFFSTGMDVLAISNFILEK